jgi:hypothetical protein
MPRFLRRLKISEVSSVDHAANDGAKILLRKRHDANAVIIEKSMQALAQSVTSILGDPNINKAAALSKTFQQFGSYLKSNVIKTRPPLDDDDTGIDNTDDDNGTLSPELEQYIAAMLAAVPSLTRQQALWITLHTAHGAAAFQSTTKTRKEKHMSDRGDELRAVAKQHGIETLARFIVTENKSYGIDEREMTKLIDDAAQLTRQPNETPDQAFSKYFSDPANVLLRRAHAITKNTPRAPVEDEPVADVTKNDDTDSDASAAAYRALVRMGDAMKTSPELTSAQAFTKAFEQNPALASLAHRRPSATASLAFPV